MAQPRNKKKGVRMPKKKPRRCIKKGRIVYNDDTCEDHAWDEHSVATIKRIKEQSKENPEYSMFYPTRTCLYCDGCK